MTTDTAAVEQIVREWCEAHDIIRNPRFEGVYLDLAKRAYTAGQQSRDAEIAELKAALAGANERLAGFKEGLTSDAKRLPA